jgi:flagellar basal-body rod protein FlgB
MNLAAIPLFAMLRDRLGYLNERQKVIAQNVANTDTAKYVPEDLKPFSFNAQVAMQRQGQAGAMATTQAGHMAPSSGRRGLGSQYKPVKSPDAAIGFYQKSLNLIRLASRPAGRV